jgi:hypothetical protein
MAGPPRRPAVQELGSRQHDDQQGQIALRRDDVFDKVKQAVTRPVQVLEDEDQWLASRGQLNCRPPRREK